MRLELLKWMKSHNCFYDDLETLLGNSDEVILDIMICERDDVQEALIEFFSYPKVLNCGEEF